MGNNFELVRFVDSFGDHAFELRNNENETIVLYGNGFETEDSIIENLSEIHEALRAIFG